MARRSKIYDLPLDLREKLNERLVGSGFQGYEELADWLTEAGHEISRSSVQRYGQDLQEEFELAMGDVRRTTEMAKAFTDQNDDTQGSLVDATARIVQEQLLRITIALRKAEHEPHKAAKYMASITHALADIGRMSLGQKKWAKQVREEAIEEAASVVEETARAQGMDEDQAKFWREKVLGIR